MVSKKLSKKQKLELEKLRFDQSWIGSALEFLKNNPEKAARLGLWATGTVVCHRLNVAGLVNWFGRGNDRVATGLPYPFAERTRFPWEREEKTTWEDKVCEWGVPALVSWMLVYHPEAVAKFVDAMIPF